MVCQKDQCMEPVGLKIETSLGCLAGRYHPSSQPEAPQPPASLASQPETRSSRASSPPRASQTAWTTPPSTPRARPGVPTTPPPLRPAHAEPLLLSLQQNCLKQVRLALEADPEAARLPFWQRRFEWPLCAAIRLGCSEEIVRLLIENGARVDVTNVEGHSPIQLLSSRAGGKIVGILPIGLLGIPGTAEWAEWVRESTVRFELGVATALLTAGADPEACHGDPGRGHYSSVDLARRAGKDHLVGLYEARGHLLTV